MKQIRVFLTAVACLMAMAASAHWQWVDKDGRKVFSDRAPPPDVLEKDILERPPVTPPTAAPQSGASAPRLSGVDKELSERKKNAEEVEAARRKAEEEKNLTARAENCRRAKQAKAGFDSGRRIARPNEKGEPELLDGATRAAEVARLQSMIDSDCK
jgi:hypothetical protein